MLIWTPWALPGVTAGLAAFVLAVTIWRTTRSRPIRRRFTLLLVVEGVGAFFGILGTPQFLLQADHYHAVVSIHFMNDCLLLAFYLPALAVAIDSPMLKPFRNGLGRWLITGYGLALFAGASLADDIWVVKTVPGLPGYGLPYTIESGPLMGLIFTSLVISYLYGLIATILAWRRATSELGRRKAGTLALAFGARDTGLILLYFGAAVSALSGIDQTSPESIQLLIYGCLIAYTGLLVYLCLVAYAIAFVNVLEVDLQVKKTLKRSTVTAVFVAFYFIVSESTAAFLSDQVGTVLALVASGGLLFFLSPLQDWASNLAEKAMPNVQDTPEYQAFRSLQIYGAAVDEALRSGGISTVNRIALDRLMAELNINPEDATELEDRLVTP